MLDLWFFVVTFVVLPAAEPAVEPLPAEAGTKVCISGYIMDKYCSQRGTLLDSPLVSTLQNPEQHSLHCLVDDDRCFSSGFEVLVPAASGSGYCRAFDLGSAGTSTMLAFARARGSSTNGCSTCTGTSASAPTRGFRATIVGTIATAAINGAAAVLGSVQVLEDGAACPTGFSESVAPTSDASLCLRNSGQAQCSSSGSIDASVDFDVKRHVSWSVDSTARNITLKLTFGGAVPGAYLAAALNTLQDPHPMANADMVVVTVSSSGVLRVRDMWSAQVGQVPRHDADLHGGRDSLEVLRHSLLNGQAEVVVRRSLDADDPHDVTIDAGSSMRLSFAHSSAATANAAAAAAADATPGGGTTPLGYHGRRVGSYEVDFFGGLASKQQASAVRKLKALHGIVMTAVWALFAVIGIFTHRYFPKQKKHHRQIMASAAGGGTVVGILIAQLFATSTLGSEHSIRGFSLLCCAVAQGAIGSYIWRYDYHIIDRHTTNVKMATVDDEKAKERFHQAGRMRAALIQLDTAMYGVARGDGVARTANVRIAHPFLGCAVFFGAQWQITSGLRAFGADPWMSKALYAWWACVAALMFQLENRKRKRKAEADRLAAARAGSPHDEGSEGEEGVGKKEDPMMLLPPRPAGNVNLQHARKFVV